MNFSKSVPDLYTAECSDMPFFAVWAKIKTVENV